MTDEPESPCLAAGLAALRAARTPAGGEEDTGDTLLEEDPDDLD